MQDGTRQTQSGAAPAAGRGRDIRVAAYSLGWAICFVGASYAIRNELVSGPLAWLVAGVPSIVAVWMLVVYTRYLRESDELQRLIQLEAMGWAFGGGFFVISGYLLFEPLGAPAIDKATLVSVMPVLFAVGMLAGWWRYR